MTAPRVPRVVLDNCVPRTILAPLRWPGATTVAEHGWANVDDGPLLNKLETVCDVFITVDRNLPFQQRLAGRPFATVVLIGRSNRLPDLLPMLEQLRRVIEAASPGSVHQIRATPNG